MNLDIIRIAYVSFTAYLIYEICIIRALPEIWIFLENIIRIKIVATLLPLLIIIEIVTLVRLLMILENL